MRLKTIAKVMHETDNIVAGFLSEIEGWHEMNATDDYDRGKSATAILFRIRLRNALLAKYGAKS